MGFLRSCSRAYSIVAADELLTEILVTDPLTFPTPVEPAVADGLLLSLIPDVGEP